MKKKKSVWKRVFFVLLILIFIVGALFVLIGLRLGLFQTNLFSGTRQGQTASAGPFQNVSSGQGGSAGTGQAQNPTADQQGSLGYSYGTGTNTVSVTRGTILSTTEGNGFIEPADQNTYCADYDLKVDKVSVENGDLIEAGDLIATLDRDSILDQIDLRKEQLSDVNSSISDQGKGGSETLSSPVGGRIKRIFVKSGDVLTDVVARHGGLMEINPTGKLKVDFSSRKHLRIGDEVTVAFQSYDEEGIVTYADGDSYTVEFSDNSSYQVDVTASIEDSDGSVCGSGPILTSHPYLVDGSYGIADEIRVDVNDRVDSGSTLLTRSSHSYNADYIDLLDDRETIMTQLQELRQLADSPRICAESSGILSDLQLTDRGSFSKNDAMYTLISTQRYWLKAQIDELDIADVKEVQHVVIVFDAFEDREYEGTVEKVSALGTNVNGVTTYTVTISLPGTEELKTAMSATATIETARKENALLVPVEALISRDKKYYVTRVTGSGLSEQEVTVGIINNTMAELTDGVSEGDVVVCESTYSSFQDMVNMMNRGRGTQS